MTTVASIQSVTTTDAAPTTAPFRVSRVSGENVATVAIRATATGIIRKLRAAFNTDFRNVPSGKIVFDRGAVCGLDRCGAPGVMPMAAASPLNVTFTINASNLPSVADGDYEVSVHALSDDGWSS